ncbi:MAG: hypothetical protein ACYCPR_12295 [Thermoplasmataceae archaeon]
MTATWVAIGVLGAFAAAVFGMVFQILSRIDGLRTELKGDISGLDTKIDGLRTELKGDISELRTELTGEIRAQTARIDQQTARIDVLVIDVGEMKGDLRALATRVAALELHQV